MSLNLLKLRKRVEPQNQPSEIKTQPVLYEKPNIKFKHSNEVYLIGRGNGTIAKTVLASYEITLNDTFIIPVNNKGWPINKEFFLISRKNSQLQTENPIEIGDTLGSRSTDGTHQYNVLSKISKVYSLNLTFINKMVSVPESDIIKIIGLKDNNNIIKLLHKYDENDYKILDLEYNKDKTYDDLLKELSNIIKNNGWTTLSSRSKMIKLKENEDYILPIYYFIYKKQYFVSESNLNGNYGTLIQTYENKNGYLLTSHKLVLNVPKKMLELNNENMTAKIISGNLEGRIVSYKFIPAHYTIYLEKMKTTIDKIYETISIEKIINDQIKIVKEEITRNITESDLFFKDLVLMNGNFFEITSINFDGTYTGREMDTRSPMMPKFLDKTISFDDIKESNVGFKIFKQQGVKMIYKRRNGKIEEVKEDEFQEESSKDQELESENVEFESGEIDEDEEKYEEPYEEEQTEESLEDQDEIGIEESEDTLQEYTDFIDQDQLQSTFKDVERTAVSRYELTKKQKEFLTRINTILNIFKMNKVILGNINNVIFEIESWVNAINKNFKDIIEEEMSSRDEKFVIANVLFNKLRQTENWFSQFKRVDIEFYMGELIKREFLNKADIELDITIFLRQNLPYDLDIAYINNLLSKKDKIPEILGIMFKNCRKLMASIDPSDFGEIKRGEERIYKIQLPNEKNLDIYTQTILELHNITKTQQQRNMILNSIKQILYKINVLLRNKNIQSISENDSKYIVAVHLYITNVIKTEDSQYVNSLIQNDFFKPDDFRTRSTLFLIDISDTLTKTEQQEMDKKLRNLAKIPDYRSILMIMYSNAKNLYESIQMKSEQEIKEAIDIPKPIVGKRKLETKIVLEETDSIDDTEYIKTRFIPSNINRIRWSKMNQKLIENYTTLIRNKIKEEKNKMNMINDFITKYVTNADKLEILLETAKSLQMKESNENVDNELYDVLKTSGLNIYNLITICKELQKTLIKGNELFKMKTNLNKIINDKQESIENIYEYIIRNFNNAPFVIRNIEKAQKELLESDEPNKLVSYQYWNIVLSHFIYLFNKFLDVISNPDIVSIMEEQKIEKQREKSRILDIRSRFPKIYEEESEMTQEKKKQKFGLSKESRKYLSGKKKEDSLPLQSQKEKDELSEDLQDVYKLQELSQSDTLSEEEQSMIDKITSDLQTKLSMDDYKGVVEEMKQLGLK